MDRLGSMWIESGSMRDLYVTMAGRDLFNVLEGQSMQFLLLLELTLEWPSTRALLYSSNRQR